ncbi:hypothetical protein ANO11243_037030 [Dothideomycetidae sp. 11243]|nr:hypothetical protein ANO11243_037030 [fungal sp. No.11243]
MDDDIEARLESHSEAFEGLLSLIPANDYYARDNSDQWQRKKQTKEEKKAARKAKLDPANRKSAMDVLNENEKKRKRELGLESGDEQAAESPVARLNKKAKTEIQSKNAAEAESSSKTKAEKRKEKRERQKEKAERQKQKSEAKKARKEEVKVDIGQPSKEGEHGNLDTVDESATVGDNDIEPIDLSGLVAEDSASTAPSTPDIETSRLDSSADHSAASSSTSIIPPGEAPTGDKTTSLADEENVATVLPSTQTVKPKKPKAFNLPKIDPEELQSRLKARIEELRARRKADGADGQPARSRQELLESRRKKSEARKAHKKELRAQAKAEEDRLNQERLQGSGSPLSADIFSPRSPLQQDNYFTFGRVAFEDGALADTNTGEAKDIKQRKGPKDPKQQLEMAKKKQERLNGFDENKRKDIEEKDRWLAAKMKVHGERVRDDSSLLKKALKRKEKSKLKSEKEWNEREEGIRKGKEMKQKKREENLAKRKEEKGGKGKGKGKPKGKPKKKGRPGFEGK